MTLPPFALETLRSKAGDKVEVSVKGDTVMLRMPKIDKKALFARLIAEQAEVQDELNQDRDWVTKRKPVGNEVL